MFRIAQILVTIAALLMCPLNCFGHPAGQCGSAEKDQGCACCPHNADSDAADSRSSQRDENPSVPCDECRCGSCLCRGAILSEDDLPLGATAGALLPAPVDVWPVEILTPQVGVLLSAASPPLPLKPSGRLLRLALESLLV